MTDKNIETHRYNKRARLLLDANEFGNVHKVAACLNVLYEYYFKLLGLNVSDGSAFNLLEIGAGMGENTKPLIDMSYNVCATDISPESVKVMDHRFSKYGNFSTEVADMEKLPFNNGSFDMVCSAGSLSYGDNIVVMNEVYRVLKQGGVFIVVDSLNNPIYRINRYIHYLRGNRSKSTLVRMPTTNLINRYDEKFGSVQVRFFGAITWLFPLLGKILSEHALAKFSDWIDARLKIKKSAFKFVMMAVKE